MTRLSSPIDRIKDHYTVVVVGSGYGGGIAASRLARGGKYVCMRVSAAATEGNPLFEWLSGLVKPDEEPWKSFWASAS
jgi:hypothetical protein